MQSELVADRLADAVTPLVTCVTLQCMLPSLNVVFAISSNFFHWHCGYCTVGLFRLLWGLKSFLLSWPDYIDVSPTSVDKKRSTSVWNVHKAWPNNLDYPFILTRRLIFVDVITSRYRVTVDWSRTIDKTLRYLTTHVGLYEQRTETL